MLTDEGHVIWSLATTMMFYIAKLMDFIPLNDSWQGLIAIVVVCGPMYAVMFVHGRIMNHASS